MNKKLTETELKWFNHYQAVAVNQYHMAALQEDGRNNRLAVSSLVDAMASEKTAFIIKTCHETFAESDIFEINSEIYHTIITKLKKL